MIVNIHGGRAAYYHAPKCGSRTILGWIALLQSPELFEENPEWFEESRPAEYRDIRKQVKLYPGTPQDWKYDPVPVVKSDFRFCVIRDPIERFLSGYVSRVLYHGNLNGAKLTIDEFIDNFDFICRINGTIETHFRSQIHFYGTDPANFHRVYRMNELHVLKTDLERNFHVRLPELRLQQSGNLKKPSLSPSQIKWVADKYAEDFQMIAAFSDYQENGP